MSDIEKTTKANKRTEQKQMVYKLACIQCSDAEIAEVLGMKVHVLKRMFKKLLEQGRENGKKSLRRAMWDKAINGDTKVQIFLSKQYLGMKDVPEANNDKGPLPWTDEKI